MKDMPSEALEQVASYFQVLAEPTRLRILNILRDGERNVGEVAQMCGYTAANISRHLGLMYQAGMLSRRREGTLVYYRVGDAYASELCRSIRNQVQLRLPQDPQVQTPRSKVSHAFFHHPTKETARV